MDFSAYTGFQQSFVARYGTYERDYPFTMMVLDLELRNVLFGDAAIAQRNLSRQTDRLWLTDQLMKWAARQTSPAPQVYIEMPGFADLASDLSRRFAAQGVSVFSERTILTQPANKLLHRLIKLGPTYSRAMARAGADGPDAILQDRALLDRLEGELAANYARLKRFIMGQNIRGFLATGDSKPFSRFLCRAARELGLPYVVMAHGYISHSTLVSIAPLHADRLIVWTERQADLMRDALPDRADDIRSFGFPSRLGSIDRSRRESRVLFAWEPLKRRGKQETHMPVLADLAGICTASGFAPVIRLHPKERKDEALAQSLRGMGFEMDGDDMTAAMSRAAVVVSSNSTVLCEAAALGVPAVQIAELAVFAFEGADLCPVAQFDPARIAAAETGQPAFPLLDIDGFFADFADLMTRTKTEGMT